ncbi:DUF1127 domain-containing protein [Bradyrhizobium erythrophlei]|uniref:YjiS-like domain-containing protein n=1 Tax=Bradyrhizobium erythrophlei TaxID=1437360 RepID=A0A1M5RDW6_9BRAD|nr:DUF1127 domain-containing protein [Bradyrhizobium erythrophlei]SHH24461.1 protein of unknown function [Bradyrhizobium erythrophlei]
MHFEKQLSDALSPLLFTGQRDARTISPSPGLSLSTTGPAFVKRYRGVRPHVYSFHQIDLRRGESHRTSGGAPIRARPEQDAPRRVIPAAIFRGGAWVIGALAATGEIVFSRFLLAFMSWTMGEVLAGCAAYAQAMYPCYVEDELVGQGDVGQGESGNPSGVKPVLRSPSRRTESTVMVPVAVERAARSEAPGVASPGCSASLTSLAGKLWSRLRAMRDRRLAVAELRSLDDRALRDIGICRFDIECFAGHGDRRE